MNHFVLADCNNFYVSCERIFNPKLEAKPVIVLSNNDGCIISRSEEAKKLGIKMGEPYFKVKDLCLMEKVFVFSSNYQLYGNISERVMSVLNEAAPHIEFYSIDEAFLSYESISFDEVLQLKKRTKKWTGVPISLGIAPTKTLAKVAGSFAKKTPLGVFDLSCKEIREEVLKEYPIENVWGIGSQLKKTLHGMGIFTASDFCQIDPSFIRRKMGVVLERILLELKGISCLSLKEASPKKSITCSRSFGKSVQDPLELAEALSTFANTASVKLRAQHSYATAFCIFLEGAFDEKTGTRPHYSRAAPFKNPTNYPPEIITMAKECLKTLILPGKSYKKCGIILLDLISIQDVAPDFFQDSTHPKKELLMDAVTAINQKYGKNALFYGAMGTNPTWIMRCDNRSGHFTTNWNDLAIVNAL